LTMPEQQQSCKRFLWWHSRCSSRDPEPSRSWILDSPCVRRLSREMCLAGRPTVREDEVHHAPARLLVAAASGTSGSVAAVVVGGDAPPFRPAQRWRRNSPVTWREERHGPARRSAQRARAQPPSPCEGTGMKSAAAQPPAAAAAGYGSRSRAE
jgi:hypothetical protein